MEILFWKVMRNKVLFYKIFNYIKNIEWEEYYEYSQIHIENKKRFKDINSLEWILVNKHYQLLKYKLELDENLEISKFSISLLLLIKDKELKKELLLLLIEKKSKEIKSITDFDFLFLLISKNKGQQIEIIEKLINSNSSDIDEKTLEWAISNSSVEIVKLFINSPNLKISNKIKFNSIKLAFSNEKYKEQMIKLILDNEKTYSIKPIGLTRSRSDKIAKIDLIDILSLNSSELSIKLLNINYYTVLGGNNSKEYKKILQCENSTSNDKIKTIFKLYSIELLNEHKNFLAYKNYLLKYGEIIDNGLNGQLVYQFSLSTFNISTFQWLLTDSKTKSTNRDFSNWNKNLNFPIADIKTIHNNNNNNNYGMENIYKFINLYTSQLIFINKEFDKIICELINNSRNEEEFNELVKSISEISLKRFIKSIPNGWNSILNKILNWDGKFEIMVNDKSSIDFIVLNSNLKGTYQEIIKKVEQYKIKSIFNYETLELSNYANSKFESIKKDCCFNFSFFENYKIEKSIIFIYPFIKAIEKCDIITLDYIITNIIDFQVPTITNLKKHQQEIKFENNSGDDGGGCETFTQDINNLVNYLFKNIKKFPSKFINELMKIIIEIDYPNFDLSKVSFNFKKLDKSINIIELFNYSIKNCLPKTLGFILNNYNLIEKGYVNSNNSELDNYFINNFNNDIEFYRSTSTEESLNDLINIIEILINHFKIIQKTEDNCNEANTYLGNYSDSDGDGEIDDTYENKKIKYLNSLKNLINSFFKKLIQIKETTKEIICKIYNLIVTSSIEIPNSLFHIIYYLSKRSMVFIKYVMENPYLEDSLIGTFENGIQYFQDYDKIIYNIDRGNFKTNKYDIKQYLNENDFTFNFIFNQSFDNILEKLIHHLSHSPSFNHKEFISTNYDFLGFSLNYNLKFLLEIKRLDLFFKELNYIQSLLLENNSTLVIGSFPNELDFYHSNNKNKKNKKNKKCCNETTIEIINGRVYYLSEEVYEFSFKIMDKESFKKFSEFCSYHSIINYLNILVKKENDNPLPLYIFNHLDRINHIVNNHSQGDDEISYSWFDLISKSNTLKKC
ncbi:hypothetical protein ACTFIW_008178 [Dictyostelium discoideum]